MDDQPTIECNRCHEAKPISAMSPNLRRNARLPYYPYCRACDNARRREQRPSKGPRREIRRKLPPYAELKRLYVEEGLSYGDIAERFDVCRSTVYLTMQRRAHAYGDQWPLTPSVSRLTKVRRGAMKEKVKPDLIILCVWAYLNEEAQRTAPMVDAWWRWVEVSHIEWTGRRPMPAGRRTAFSIALDRLCKEHGFTRSYLREIHQGRVKLISREYGRRLLVAIGEEYHPVLATHRAKKYTGRDRVGGQTEVA